MPVDVQDLRKTMATLSERLEALRGYL